MTQTTPLSNIKLTNLPRGHFRPICTVMGYRAIVIHRKCDFWNQKVKQPPKSSLKLTNSAEGLFGCVWASKGYVSHFQIVLVCTDTEF